jgi:hypothetical protein
VVHVLQAFRYRFPKLVYFLQNRRAYAEGSSSKDSASEGLEDQFHSGAAVMSAITHLLPFAIYVDIDWCSS